MKKRLSYRGRSSNFNFFEKQNFTNNEAKKAYSYEATKIELLAGTLVGGKSSNPSTSNSITAANLLQDVEKSYGNGKKLLDSSKVVDENGESKVVYHGTKLQEMYFKDGRPYTNSIPRFYVFQDSRGHTNSSMQYRRLNVLREAVVCENSRIIAVCTPFHFYGDTKDVRRKECEWRGLSVQPFRPWMD